MGLPDVISKYLLPGGGVATPAQLYEEAAPRVQAALKQYDQLAPKIEFMANNWPLFVGLTIFGGALAVIGGNYAYDYLTDLNKKS